MKVERARTRTHTRTYAHTHAHTDKQHNHPRRVLSERFLTFPFTGVEKDLLGLRLVSLLERCREEVIANFSVFARARMGL